jgi:catechol 2,3-dioxygenase
LYPSRKELAIIYDRLQKANYSLTGVSDHGVSEALYLDDPDGNGLNYIGTGQKNNGPTTLMVQ